MAKEHIERDAVIELLEEKQRAICPVGRCGHGYVYGRDRDEYDAIEADIDAVQNIPTANVVPIAELNDAVDKTLRILDAINSSGFITYNTYCELHNAIYNIYQNCGATKVGM